MNVLSLILLPCFLLLINFCSFSIQSDGTITCYKCKGKSCFEKPHSWSQCKGDYCFKNVPKKQHTKLPQPHTTKSSIFQYPTWQEPKHSTKHATKHGTKHVTEHFMKPLNTNKFSSPLWILTTKHGTTTIYPKTSFTTKSTTRRTTKAATTKSITTKLKSKDTTKAGWGQKTTIKKHYKRSLLKDQEERGCLQKSHSHPKLGCHANECVCTSNFCNSQILSTVPSLAVLIPSFVTAILHVYGSGMH